MSDLKSKLPDLEEITSIASKFFTDMKNSVSEIVDDYKKKRAPEVTSEKSTKDSTKDKES